MERYADEIDRASALEEAERRHLINKAKNSTTIFIKSTGFCHNCNSELRHPLLFCDDECAEDYEYLTACRRRNGDR